MVGICNHAHLRDAIPGINSSRTSLKRDARGNPLLCHIELCCLSQNALLQNCSYREAFLCALSVRLNFSIRMDGLRGVAVIHPDHLGAGFPQLMTLGRCAEPRVYWDHPAMVIISIGTSTLQVHCRKRHFVPVPPCHGVGDSFCPSTVTDIGIGNTVFYALGKYIRASSRGVEEYTSCR